ncbi:hypothetical protein [Spiroplasma tabanidicola]|uniref:Transmembrane protein n=1 Tax=Spiroplasma tabanidicola TaxID=324079 RepID=A0A6I6C842_9MOLU|nr:hypothetical protein [Spiroplasma tabanidicola]QGS51599.1 hypothetical protein STABA_v1c02320 [Spiroplasma tabanidicola]
MNTKLMNKKNFTKAIKKIILIATLILISFASDQIIVAICNIIHGFVANSYTFILLARFLMFLLCYILIKKIVNYFIFKKTKVKITKFEYIIIAIITIIDFIVSFKTLRMSFYDKGYLYFWKLLKWNSTLMFFLFIGLIFSLLAFDLSVFVISVFEATKKVFNAIILFFKWVSYLLKKTKELLFLFFKNLIFKTREKINFQISNFNKTKEVKFITSNYGDYLANYLI